MKWEDICSRCSLCCHEKIIDGDYLIISDITCDYLDTVSGLCTVYEKRFEKCERCMKVNLFRACFASYLPPGCQYVLWAKKHHIRFAKDKKLILSYGKDAETDKLD